MFMQQVYKQPYGRPSLTIKGFAVGRKESIEYPISINKWLTAVHHNFLNLLRLQIL